MKFMTILIEFFISFSFLIVSFFAACPNYPYTPLGGANWEYWCDDWQLAEPGNGNISFNATGNDFYVGLFDNQTAQGLQYVLKIAGEGNANSWLGNFTSARISPFVPFSIPDITRTNLWTVEFNKSQKSISVSYEGTVIFSYVDSNYLNQAGNAQYISFSQCVNSVVLYKDCPTYPYSPRNGVDLSVAYWEYFCPDCRY